MLAGPSPRAWGKQRFVLLRDLPLRSIPTGVGKTEYLASSIRNNPVHPHGRGENQRIAFVQTFPSGPSPRAWGKREGAKLGAQIIRSIPTGVGKTEEGYKEVTKPAVHPHGRGENWSQSYQFHRQHGPSPRAWGKHSFPHGTLASTRSIPTGVGKTVRCELFPLTCPVHPHGRGENGRANILKSEVNGPSPRAWGKRQHLRLALVEVRSIPTGVGKTAIFADTEEEPSVHPHGRGENDFGLLISFSANGPSPRAWGKPCCQLKSWERFGPSPRAWGKPSDASFSL